MKKLILTLLILCFATSSAPATSISLCNSGTATALTSVNLCNAGTSTQVIPKIWDGSAWYAMISYGSAEWRLFVGMGQSNLVGNPESWCNTGTIPTVTVAGIEIHTDDTYTNPLAEPTGNNDPPFDQSGQEANMDQGSIWPEFVNRWYLYTEQKVIVLSIGVNGSPSSAWISTYCAQAKTHIDNALTQLNEDGYDFVWEDILWCQGEQDNMDGVSSATYKANLGTIFSYFKAQYPTNALQFQMIYAYGMSGEHDAQDGMDSFAIDNADAYVVYSSLITSPGLYHYTQAQLNWIAEVASGIIKTQKGF